MTKILGPEVGYVDLLDHATTEKLTQDMAEGREYQKSPLRPSSSGSCTRELYYNYMQFAGKARYAVEVNAPEVHRLLNLGHSIEYHILKQFEMISGMVDIRYKQQVLSFTKLEATDPKFQQWLEGSLDMVFWSEKHKCVADVKSKKDKYSSYYKTSWDDTTEKLKRMRSVKAISDKAFWVENLEEYLQELNDPFFASNFLQLNLYANSDFLKERGIDHGAIIQYNKNDSRLREIRFKPCAKLYQKVLNKFQTVINAVETDNEALATRDYTLGSIKCAFCKFKNECWVGGKDAQRAFFDTFPKKQWPTDVGRLGDHAAGIEKLFTRYEDLKAFEKEKEVVERAILLIMAEKRVNKLKRDCGDVYEAKQLKEKVSLRRSKA